MMKPPTHLNNPHVIVPSVEVRLVIYIVDNILVSGVEEIIRMKFVLYAVMKLKKSFVTDSNPSSFIDSPNIFNPPPQPQTSQPAEESIKEFFIKHAQEMITTVQSAVKIAIHQHEQTVQKEQEE
ncbi:hypothetical protein Tco_1463289 [Tanacetum coccineum]